MKRLEDLFQRKSASILNVYVTAGYPQLDSTLPLLQALQDSGADIVELGMPYSDPLADGPVIQQSGSIALENGMTIRTLLEQLKGFRDKIHMPVILMGYMNPVMQYGFERFCADAASVGVDALILPDLPMYEFETQYRAILERHNLDFIFLVTPETSEERIRKIDSLSTGFVYAVSSSSTTGSVKKLSSSDEYFQRLKNLQLKNKLLIGFGIADKESFDHACRYANGAIIGSAFIKALHGKEDVVSAARDFVSGIR
ncbi:MAG TPA: tryptophan synthase subunit alpha [Flavitalea sp.]|nr:tryptophan synthase subunit alpha [Flavitalea sp.]